MIACPGCDSLDITEIRVTTTERAEEYAIECADCGITWPAGWITGLDGPELDGPSVHVQPIFTLKSAMDPGEPMRVTASDYHDPARWWL